MVVLMQEVFNQMEPFVVGNNVFSNVIANNFYPAVNSALISAGVNPQDLPAVYDFNGNLRSTTKPTVGAYVSFFIQHNMYFVFELLRNFLQQPILVVQ